MRGLSGTRRIFPALGLAAIVLLLPRAAHAASDLSFTLYEQGRAAFEDQRLGEALTIWRSAIDERERVYAKASAQLEAALAGKEGKTAKGSIRGLLDRFARDGFSAREISLVTAEAKGSLRREAELWKSRNPSTAFFNYLDALLAVLALRPAEAFGDSLEKLLATSRALQGYPEAEFGIGRIFVAEGELGLAELQFSRALELAASLEIPEQRYEIREALTVLYEREEKWKEYEESLRSLLDGSDIFSEKNAFLRQAMERALLLQGIDSLIGAYRVADFRIARSTAAFGEYLLRHGRSQAVIHLAIAVDSILSRAMERIKEREPSFAYSTIGALLERITREAELRVWVEGEGLGKTLYYLGEALLAVSERAAARSVLEPLSRWSTAGAWARAAAIALARPVGTAVILP